MKRIFLAPIIIAACFVFVFLLILPQYEEYLMMQEKTVRARENLVRSEKQFSDLQKIVKEIEKNKESIAKIESGLPQEFSLASLFDYLQNEVENNGLLLKGISLQQDQVKSKPQVDMQEQQMFPSQEFTLKEHFVDLNIIGSLNALQSFVSSLDKSSRLIFISSLHSGVSTEEMPSFSLVLKVYSRSK